MFDFAAYFDVLSATPPSEPDDRLVVAGQDDVTLRAGLFLPRALPVTDIVLLQHGGSVHAGLGYDRLADSLRSVGGVAVATPDLRGHGKSSGARGFAARPAVIWDDLCRVVAAFRERFPGARLHLVGHSSGGGVLLNALANRPALAAQASSLTLIAPFLGPGVGARKGARPRRGSNGFSQVHNLVLLGYVLSGTHLFRRSTAVRFAFPLEFCALAGCVRDYTPGMAMAVTPRNALRQLTQITVPTLLVAGLADEVFSPRKLHRIVGQTSNPLMSFSELPGNHFDCMLNAGAAVRRHVLGPISETA